MVSLVGSTSPPAIDPNHKEVMMADKSGNAIYSFSFPEAWETFEPVTAPPGPRRGRGGAAQRFDLDSLRVAFRALASPPGR